MAVLELCRRNDPSARLSLPGMTVFREYGRVVFGGEGGATAGGFEPIYPALGDSIAVPGIGLKLSCKLVQCSDIIHGAAPQDASAAGARFAPGCPDASERGAKRDIIYKSETSFIFKSADICGRITVRPRREGDAIRLFGKSAKKTLKKLFIERRIPAWKRALVPVVADDAGVLAVYGLGMGDRAVPEKGDAAVQISFEDA